MTTLLRFWVVATISHVVEETMAQQCPSERSISGWMLQRHVYKTMLADIGLHCLLSCGTDDRCQSFNFVMSSHMCEFSDRTKEATPEDFIRDPDRFYFGKRVNRGNLNIINQFDSDKRLSSISNLMWSCLVPLGSIPELAAKSCKEIKMSEKGATSGKYWLSSIRPGIPLFAFCNMTTEGKWYMTSICEILFLFVIIITLRIHLCLHHQHHHHLLFVRLLPLLLLLFFFILIFIFIFTFSLSLTFIQPHSQGLYLPIAKGAREERPWFRLVTCLGDKFIIMEGVPFVRVLLPLLFVTYKTASLGNYGELSFDSAGCTLELPL